MKKIAIIVVNYNGRAWLEKCFSSFENLTGWEAKKGHPDIDTVLVDNGSSDDSLEVVTQKFPWVQIIPLEKNVGFSAGNNVGIQRTKNPYVMLLNSDTEFLPGTDLLSLLQHFENKDIGIVTPKVVLDSGELDHACHRGFPTPWNAFCYFSGLGKLFPKVPIFAGYRQSWKDLSTMHTVEACTGAAMIVPRVLTEKIGLLDESYFMYGEDIDWCYRFAQAGKLCFYDPSVTVLHHKHKSGLASKSAWETKERSTAAFFDTMKQFYKKFYAARYPRLVGLVLFFVIDTMKQRKIDRERKKYADA